ncbi:uncharacterized protein A4U43_C04F29550 [Asparagus officinalis]|uniref:KIB1-4 beta-propeller domain-containing protein n=1 Tax=Asparagus officinalis TaxID=4686 RepID=A0A5P1F4K2_ASPOF|nr:uncharacterized protein A4U43_C04F29550 [Asparagus officinalis]
MCDEGSEMLMHVLDPSLPAPSMQVLEMGDSWEYPYTISGCYLFQELNGEILMLVEEVSGFKFEDFHLFRADLSRKIWVTIEGIGRRALFVDGTSGFSLLSAGVGCHNNCIYLAPGFLKFDIDAHFHEPWRMLEIFDLETMSFISEQQAPDSSTKQVLLQFDRNRLRWFVPSL